MYYSCFKRRYPNEILIYIEEFNKQNGTVLFDFLDFDEYSLFTNTINRNYDLSQPTMVLLENYNKRTIREDTIYSIKPEIIQTWRKQSSIDSFLIGYIIDVSETQDEIFNTPVSLDESFYFFLNNIYGGEDIEKIPFPSLGKSSVTIRNVGQGNWNEINYDNKVKVVYDAGQGKRIKI